MKYSFLAAMAIAACSMGAAQAATIDFSTNNGSALSHGDFVDGAFDFDGITGTISTTGGSGMAQVFDSSIDPSIATSDPDLQQPKSFVDDSRTAAFGNILIINENESRVDDNSTGGSITFMFDEMVYFSGLNLIDIESNQPVTILADGFNSGPLSNEDNYYSFFAPSEAILTSSLTFLFAGSGGIDNLQVSEVPLPASALLLLGGMAAFGAVRRKKT